MAGCPAGNLYVRCAVSRSVRAICERSQRGSLTAILIATPITAKAQSWPLKIMRVHHPGASPFRGTERSTSPYGTSRHGSGSLPEPSLANRASARVLFQTDRSVVSVRVTTKVSAAGLSAVSWRHGIGYALHCRIRRRMIRRSAALDKTSHLVDASSGTVWECRVELISDAVDRKIQQLGLEGRAVERREGAMARIAWRTARSGFMLLLAGAAFATNASADDVTVTKALPAASAKAPSQPATCGSLEDFAVTNCPLTWNGITVYGTIDAGVTWRSPGAPFNGTPAVGEDYLIQKYSNRAQWGLAPNGLSQ